MPRWPDTWRNFFFGDDIDPALLRREMERIYDFPLPLRRVGSRYTLELFHGPTFAFKRLRCGLHGADDRPDGRCRRKTGDPDGYVGDTGSAVAHGFYGCRASRWCCSIPKGRSAGCRSAR